MEIWENGNLENGKLEELKYGKIKIGKNGHEETRKLDIRRNGIWGKRILGKMEIWNNSKMEICKFVKREMRKNGNCEKWKFEKIEK